MKSGTKKMLFHITEILSSICSMENVKIAIKVMYVQVVADKLVIFQVKISVFIIIFIVVTKVNNILLDFQLF